MGKLSPNQKDTEELPAVAPFTAEEIDLGLASWSRNLKVAQAEGNILGIKTAFDAIDSWLDRKNRL